LVSTADAVTQAKAIVVKLERRCHDKTRGALHRFSPFSAPRNPACSDADRHEVDGTQHIAVQSGWGVDARPIQDALATGGKVAGLSPRFAYGES
jgi:hypothetical protein